KTSGLVTHDLEGHEFEKTCNNDKILSEIQLEHEKEDEFVMVVMKTLGGSEGKSFWEEGDDFSVDVLRFHTCLTDIIGFLEKLEWWFEQDIDDEEEEDEEGEGGSEMRSKEPRAINDLRSLTNSTSGIRAMGLLIYDLQGCFSSRVLKKKKTQLHDYG
nr:hypothetical protein [Tanacetum cinerariifolium]